MTALLKRYKRNKVLNISGIGAICIVLIVVFGLLGASYASWTQHFNIFSFISAGEVDIEIIDLVLESSDAYESLSFTAHKDGGIVDMASMNVVSSNNPFSAVLVFTVKNKGTLPVKLVGIDHSAAGDLEVEILEAPPLIDVDDTDSITVRITKGYCSNFNFSTFLEFEQYNTNN